MILGQIGTRETLGRAGMPQSRGDHFVKSRITGRVAYLTVDHPPLNAISVEIMQALAELVRAHGRDDNVRASFSTRQARSHHSPPTRARSSTIPPGRRSSGCCATDKAPFRRLSFPRPRS